QTTTATTATFTAVVAQVNAAAGTISLTQTEPTTPKTVHDSPTVTADYLGHPLLLVFAKVGATVQATGQRVHGAPVVTTLNGVFAVPQVALTATASPATTNPAVLNPARLTPSGIQ